PDPPQCSRAIGRRPGSGRSPRSWESRRPKRSAPAGGRTREGVTDTVPVRDDSGTSSISFQTTSHPEHRPRLGGHEKISAVIDLQGIAPGTIRPARAPVFYTRTA